jgi:hypothetical protein
MSRHGQSKRFNPSARTLVSLSGRFYHSPEKASYYKEGRQIQ